MPNFKVKAQEKDKQVVRDVLDDSCYCYGFSCCPKPHYRLEPIDGSDKDHMWNDGTQMVLGTKEEFLAAVDAL